MSDERRDDPYDGPLGPETGSAGDEAGPAAAGGRRDDDLLDLPLGTGGGAGAAGAGQGSGQDAGGSAEHRADPARDRAPEQPPDPTAPAGPTSAAGGEAEPAGGRAGERPNRLPVLVLVALGLILLLALAAVVGYLLPRSAPGVLRAEPSMVDFGARSVAADGSSLEVRLENTGERPARVEGVVVAPPGGPGGPDRSDGGGDGEEAPRAFRIASDACSGTTLAPGSDCVVAVAFGPEATGTLRAALVVDGEFANAPVSLTLLGEGLAPHLDVAPQRIDFGSRAVGAEEASRVVTVENGGSAPLDLDGVTVDGPAAGDFRVAASACTARPIAPGDGCPLSVSFVPTAEGERRATLGFRPAGGGRGAATPTVALGGVGLAARIRGRLEVASPAGAAERGVGFGPVIVGRQRDERIRLANRGEEPLEIGEIGAVPEDGAFSLASNDCPAGGVLAAGATCGLTVRFEPEAEGAAEGGLRVTGSAGAVAAEVALRGRGVVPRLVPRPGELRFDESRVGRDGLTREVVWASTGSAAVEVADVAVAGADSGAFALRSDRCAGTVLEPGEECRMEVTFRPRQEGVQSARLRIRSPSLDAPAEVALGGAGAAARIGLDPGEVSFGRVFATREESRTVTVTSSGRAPLEVARVDVAGPDAGAFEVMSETCSEPLALAPGETCRITVRFAPSRYGERRALLVIAHDGVGGPARLELTGTALPAPAPRFVVSPDRVRFGARAAGARSGIETITVRNAGTDRLVLREVTIGGPDAGDFRIVPGSCEGAPYVSPGSECTVGVRFVPSGSGPRRATLVLRHNAGEGVGRVVLTGSGSGG